MIKKLNFNSIFNIASICIILAFLFFIHSNVKEYMEITNKNIEKNKEEISEKMNKIRLRINNDFEIKEFVQDIILKTNDLISYEKSYILAEEIVNTSSRYKNITPTLLTSVIYQESRFNEMIVSNVGAKGLGQIMPETADWICAKWNLSCNDSTVFDPIINIRMTAWYLDWLYNHPEICKNNDKLTLAYYNGGGRQAYRFSLYIRKENKEELNEEEIAYLNKLSDETKKYVIEVLEREKQFTELLNRG